MQNSYNIVFCNRYYTEKRETDYIIKKIKDGTKKDTDAYWMWLAYGQTYYHELMHFGGLVNETTYDGLMQDLIKPYQLQLIADNFGTKGKWYGEAGQTLNLSTMYLRESVLRGLFNSPLHY